MNRGRILGMCLILVMMLLAACAPKAAPPPAPHAPAPAAAAPAAPAAPAAAAPIASVKAAWEMEWEKTLEAAQKEGKVIFTVGAAEPRKALTEGFEKAYGINMKVESVTIRSGYLTPKITAERRAGLYIWDVCITGSSLFLNELKPLGVLDPLEPLLILPDLTNPELIKKTWYGGEIPWIDRDHTVVMGLLFPDSAITINTKLVKEGEIKSYQDLLDPKWKGKMILLDPTVSGISRQTFMPMIILGGVAGGTDWLRKLAKNEPIIMRDERLMLDWLAHGKVAILISPKPDVVVEFLRVGAPIANVIPKEGTALSGTASGISALNRRPHPNAAKVFVNWYLSQEGQTAMSMSYGGQSARLDVATDFLPPERIRQPGAPYWIKEIEENLLRQPEVNNVAKEIFGPLIK